MWAYLVVSAAVCGVLLVAVRRVGVRASGDEGRLFALPSRGRRASSFARAVVLSVGIWALSMVLSWFVEAFVPVLAIPLRAAASDSGGGFGAAVAGIVSGCVIAPLFEESWLRGVGLPGLVSCGMPFAAANAVQALVFGALHHSPAQMLTAVVSGLMLGLLARRVSSIVPRILAHAIVNSLLPSMALSALLGSLYAYSLLDLLGYRTPAALENSSFATFLAVVCGLGVLCCATGLIPSAHGRRREDSPREH